MSRFLVLIYGEETTWDAWDDAQEAANGRAHGRFAELAGAAVVSVAEVQRSRHAVSVRAGADGAAVAAPGPFVEARHAIGGYYVLETPTLDAAVALASHLPEATAPGSGIEVRPLVDGAAPVAG